VANVRRYQVGITGLHGGPGISTYHFGLAATDQDIADAVEAFWTTLAPVIENSLLFEGGDFVETIDMATEQTVSAVAVTSWSVAGTHADDPLPPTTQGLIRWDTGVYLAGRKQVGHTFIPGPVEAFNTSAGQPVVGYRDGLFGAADDLITAGVGLCVYSRKNANFSVINSASAWSEWAVLRGRRDG